MTEQEPTMTVETFAETLPDRFLRCRELGHVWRPSSVAYDRATRTYDRVIRCTSCRTERVQTLNESGHVLSNRYRYAEHYLAGANVETGVGVSRDVFRLESVLRFLRAVETKAS